jgi:hypothetical protein
MIDDRRLFLEIEPFDRSDRAPEGLNGLSGRRRAERLLDHDRDILHVALPIAPDRPLDRHRPKITALWPPQPLR